MATQVLPEIWKADDDWTEVTEREERKKRQNRLNQRVHRRKNAEKDEASGKKKAFRVERFRITEVPPIGDVVEEPEKECLVKSNCNTLVCQSNSHSTADKSVITQWDLNAQIVPAGFVHEENCDQTILIPHRSRSSQDRQYDAYEYPEPIICHYASVEVLSRVEALSRQHFPLSSDHLIHLVHYNVFRALVTNKSILTTSTVLTPIDTGIEIPLSNKYLCDGLTTIRPTYNQNLPWSLQPTAIQMSLAHSSLLNMFPFPQMRDNLIQFEHDFNHLDLCNDIFGELVSYSDGPALPRQWNQCPSTESDAIEPVDEIIDELTIGRNGFLVWGECFDPCSWEITEGFVKKWAWTLVGCEDLFVSSNRWRATRGLGPLTIPCPKEFSQVPGPFVETPWLLAMVH